MTPTVGVAILRRAAALVQVQGAGPKRSIVLEHRLPRRPGATVADVLQELLAQRPGLAASSLSIALSPADLACSDAWTLPEPLRGASAARVATSLCEVRCASETLENLVVDVVRSGTGVRAVAFDRRGTDEILAAAQAFRPVQITSVPAVLASVFGEGTYQYGGERIEVAGSRDAATWRTRPTDAPESSGALSWNGREIAPDLAAAFAAAVSDPDLGPNLLSALPRHRKTFAKRYQDQLLGIAAAAALCLGALGVRFHRELAREREELAAAHRAEMELWARLLPAEAPREGRLLRTLRERLEDLGEGGGGPEFPSALAFWGEIGRQMPDPDALGLTLESLDLAPDGGRISARLPAAKEDPLKNASQLEAKFNQSGKMTARGDYEVRDGQVQVRLRMDYKP